MFLLIALAPILNAAQPSLSTSTFADRDDQALFAPQDSRKLSSLVLSCLFTLFTCIWCCIRPDVPSPTDSRIRVLITKLNIIFWTLVAPELVLFWAFRQWLEAGMIAKEYKSRGWTRAQGLFLVMGGFMLYKDDKPVQTLSIQRFRILLRAGAIDFPSTTIHDIRDRSKLHPLLAGIVILQSGWFATQCIARLVNDLIITQLEVVTLALIVMNGLILILWWDKPLDIRYPVRIDTRFDLRRAITEPGPKTIKDDYKREAIFGTHIKRIFIDEYQPEDKMAASLASRIIRSVFRFLLTWPLKSLYKDVGRLTISNQSATIPDGALKVPLFYAPDTTDFLQFVILPAIFIGTIFGAVHCLFWSSGHFPSDFTRLLWRISSFTAAGFSGVSLVLLLLILATQLWIQFAFHRVLEFIANFFIYLGICMFLLTFLQYVIARIAILILSLICLKELPSEALITTAWTNYIPHFS